MQLKVDHVTFELHDRDPILVLVFAGIVSTKYDAIRAYGQTFLNILTGSQRARCWELLHADIRVRLLVVYLRDLLT